MPPLTCVCGSQTFSQIHCIEPGILALRCFACSLLMNVSVSAMAAEAAWERMEAEAPAPGWQKTHHVVKEATEPTTPKRSGSKYGGLL